MATRIGTNRAGGGWKLFLWDFPKALLFGVPALVVAMVQLKRAEIRQEKERLERLRNPSKYSIGMD